MVLKHCKVSIYDSNWEFYSKFKDYLAIFGCSGVLQV